MSRVYFIGDLHLGHQGILKFQNGRKFDTMEEHNQALVDRWNSVVKKADDVVWVLGDVAFGVDNLHYLSQMTGRKKLVMGNHDHYEIRNYDRYFDKIYGAVRYHEFMLTHIPVHAAHNRWFCNIHGHVHHGDGGAWCQYHDDGDKWNLALYYNVNADTCNLTPVSLEQIREELKPYRTRGN